MLTSPTVTRMFKDRGLTIEGMDLKTPKPNTTQIPTKAQKTGTKAAMIPGQSAATESELAKELTKAETEGNNQLVASLLETLMSRDLSAEERSTYQAKKCHLMFKMGRYNEAEESALNVLRNLKSLSDEALLNSLLILSRCRLEIGKIDQGYSDLVRAQAVLWDWEARGVFDEKSEGLKTERDVESWKDSAQDKDVSGAEELRLTYSLRYTREANTTSTIAVTGANIQSYLLGLGDGSEIKENKSLFKVLPEFRNRKVLSVACGEHHTLALVEGDIFNLYTPEDLKAKGRGTFGAPDLFGWGENSCGQITGYETTQNLRKPTVIRHFMGVDIQGIHASRANSIAYDSNGNVYEWGHRPTGDVSVQITFNENVNKKIQAVRLGNQFSTVLTEGNKLFFKGDISGALEGVTEYQPIQTSFIIVQVECGNSHIIILSDAGDVFTMGRNNLGQLGVGDSTTKSEKLIQAEVPSWVSKPTRVFAFKDISAFVNAEQELYMWGAIHDARDTKVKWKPFQYELDYGNGISYINGSGNTLFLLDNQGQTYSWDLGNSSKFKRYSDENECFSEISMGKGFQVLMKSFVEPNLCTIEVQNQNAIETFKAIDFKVKLKDRSGPHHYNSTYPIRYYVYMSQKPAGDLTEIQQKVIADTNAALQSAKNPSVTLSAFGGGDVVVQNVAVRPDRDDHTVHNLELTVQKEGLYCLYLFMNEKLIKDAPFLFNAGRSSQQEELLQKEEERRKREEELRRLREEERQRKLLEQQRENEEREKRHAETELRAQEALKEHSRQQKEKELRDLEERKLRKEAAVGGGFDLNKLKNLPKPAPLDVRADIKLPQQARMERTGTKMTSPPNTISMKTPVSRGTPQGMNSTQSSERSATSKGSTPNSSMKRPTAYLPKVQTTTTPKIKLDSKLPRSPLVKPPSASMSMTMTMNSMGGDATPGSIGSIGSMNNTATSLAGGVPGAGGATPVGNKSMLQSISGTSGKKPASRTTFPIINKNSSRK